MLVAVGISVLSEGWEVIPRHFVCQIEGGGVHATIEKSLQLRTERIRRFFIYYNTHG